MRVEHQSIRSVTDSFPRLPPFRGRVEGEGQTPINSFRSATDSLPLPGGGLGWGSNTDQFVLLRTLSLSRPFQGEGWRGVEHQSIRSVTDSFPRLPPFRGRVEGEGQTPINSFRSATDSLPLPGGGLGWGSNTDQFVLLRTLSLSRPFQGEGWRGVEHRSIRFVTDSLPRRPPSRGVEVEGRTPINSFCYGLSPSPSPFQGG